MHELKTWNGMREIIPEFESMGFGLVTYFGQLASKCCGNEFTAEEFLEEQYSIGERHINRVFDRTIPDIEQGKFRARLQSALSKVSGAERMEMFEEPLYRFQKDESDKEADDFVVERKTHIREYAERLAAPLGYVRQSRSKSHARRCLRRFHRWSFYGGFEVDVGGSDSKRPVSVDLPFFVGVGEEGHTYGAIGFGPGGILGGARFYGLLLKPRDFTKPPPAVERATESRMAKHAIRAQVLFFDLLLNKLGEAWEPPAV